MPAVEAAGIVRGMGESLRIDRVSADDLMSLATERGTTPTQVGAVLFLDTGGRAGSATGPGIVSAPGLDAAQVVEQLARRLPGVPRLRQRLVSLPFGCGRPIWVDDPGFDVSRHVRVVACPAPGGEQAVLDLAATMLVTPLPRSRALWAATLVTGVGEHQAVLVIVFHHVLADGVSVPFSERRGATTGELGNRSGVIPIRVPGAGDPARRLRFVAEGTRRAKRSSPGATTALLGPFFRLLARTGLFQWFVDRQRLIHTFVSNLRGPE